MATELGELKAMSKSDLLACLGGEFPAPCPLQPLVGGAPPLTYRYCVSWRAAVLRSAVRASDHRTGHRQRCLQHREPVLPR